MPSAGGHGSVAPGLHGVKGPFRAFAALRFSLSLRLSLDSAPSRRACALRQRHRGVAAQEGNGQANASQEARIVSEKNDKVEQLQADIEQGVADLVEGEDWQQWLRVASRFPRYSFRNTLLIQAQRPDATVVMGYRAWQALGHQVRKAEKSISILAPCTYKTHRNDDDDRDDEEPAKKGTTRRVLRGFRIAHVFDLSSTDGETVRPPAPPALLEGEAPAGLWEALAVQVEAAGFTLSRGAVADSLRWGPVGAVLLGSSAVDPEAQQPAVARRDSQRCGREL